MDEALRAGDGDVGFDFIGRVFEIICEENPSILTNRVTSIINTFGVGYVIKQIKILVKLALSSIDMSPKKELIYTYLQLVAENNLNADRDEEWDMQSANQLVVKNNQVKFHSMCVYRLQKMIVKSIVKLRMLNALYPEYLMLNIVSPTVLRNLLNKREEAVFQTFMYVMKTLRCLVLSHQVYKPRWINRRFNARTFKPDVMNDLFLESTRSRHWESWRMKEALIDEMLELCEDSRYCCYEQCYHKLPIEPFDDTCLCVNHCTCYCATANSLRSSFLDAGKIFCCSKMCQEYELKLYCCPERCRLAGDATKPCSAESVDGEGTTRI